MTVREYLRPRSVAEAVALLERHGPEVLVIAGGTVAMPLINEGVSLPERVMGLRHAGLGTIERDGDTLRIGAAVTLTQLLNDGTVPLLREAALNTASWAVRNLATVGGNLFTPPPGGDVAVALLALDAQVRIAGPRGERVVPIRDFFTGFLATALDPDELVVAVDVPVVHREAAFVKLGRKHANTPAVVTVAVAIERAGDGLVRTARIGLGAVGPHPIRAAAAEAALAGSALDGPAIAAAADAALHECDPFTDAIATAWYRRRMVGVVVRHALERIAGSR